MREILFRGKDHAGNWHYGTPLVLSENFVCMTAPNTYNTSVIPETVGQYTGLNDQNGKKIFEGDIVRETVRNAFSTKTTFAIYEVEFSLGLCGFEPFANYDSDCGIYTYAEDCEVIGNIYDNPELLN